MTRLTLLFVLFTATCAAYGNPTSGKPCAAESMTWDSDGKSPYENHAECIANLPATNSGDSQGVTALTNEQAGGVGYAVFQCTDGVWTMDTTNFGKPGVSTEGFCAD